MDRQRRSRQLVPVEEMVAHAYVPLVSAHAAVVGKRRPMSPGSRWMVAVGYGVKNGFGSQAAYFRWLIVSCFSFMAILGVISQSDINPPCARAFYWHFHRIQGTLFHSCGRPEGLGVAQREVRGDGFCGKRGGPCFHPTLRIFQTAKAGPSNLNLPSP
jgi:hypothetical protein